MKDRTGDRAESLDRARAEERVLRAAAVAREPVRREDFAHRERGRRRRVDNANVTTGDLLDQFAQQRVVRATEKERVDDRPHDAALGEKWLGRLARPVWHASLVAEVEGRFVRELAAKLAQHGEPADAGVEHAYRPVGGPVHRSSL